MRIFWVKNFINVKRFFYVKVFKSGSKITVNNNIAISD